MIVVSISSENDGIVVNCSGLPDARAWIEITNLSPISLKLVGTEATLNWVGPVAMFISLERIELPSHSKRCMHLSAVINNAQAKHVSENHESDKVRLTIRLHFESVIRNILKQREICASNARLLNAHNAYIFLSVKGDIGV